MLNKNAVLDFGDQSSFVVNLLPNVKNIKGQQLRDKQKKWMNNIH